MNDAYFAGFGIAGIEFVRNELSTPQVIQLHDFLGSKSLSPFEKFLVEKTSLDRDDLPLN